MRKVDKIIVHCSDTPNDRNVTVDEIDLWHRELGFDEIGYHYVIYRDGEIADGRNLSKIGAHCKGYNTGSIGICLIGRDDFTNKQRSSLNWLCGRMNGYLRIKDVYGHRDFNKDKTCPNFEVKEMVA